MSRARIRSLCLFAYQVGYIKRAYRGINRHLVIEAMYSAYMKEHNSMLPPPEKPCGAELALVNKAYRVSRVRKLQHPSRKRKASGTMRAIVDWAMDNEDLIEVEK